MSKRAEKAMVEAQQRIDRDRAARDEALRQLGCVALRLVQSPDVRAVIAARRAEVGLKSDLLAALLDRARGLGLIVEAS